MKNTKTTLLALVAGLGLAGAASGQAYSEDFTGQDGKGKIGTAAVDTTGVDWTIDVNNGTYSDNSDYFAVGEDTLGVFSVQDNDAQGTDLDSWLSPSFSISGFTGLSFSFDAYADGDFEATSDQFNVVFLLDGVEQTLVSSSVDESAPGDPMSLNGIDVSGTTLKTISSAITGTGTTGQIRIDLGNNAGSEVYAFDNISVVPEPSAYALLAGMLGLGYVMVRRRRA
ncbi:MAG: PEP-CTERM sorting domain-containing protein [Verrucomicrobia bacterium]|jgi:hypothetical protein|nr:PEP-CTERM sorting domain-containing protein [Verrucomicrobiota bacterium]